MIQRETRTTRVSGEYAPTSIGTSIRTRSWLAIAFVILLGILAIVTVGPILPILGLVGGAIFLAILAKGYKVFLTYLVFLLLGYLLLGKGFAYIGIAPVYVSEVGLALASLTSLVVFLSNGLKRLSFLARPEIMLLLVFIVWQALRTVPYLETYGIDAFRDAALWGYAAFVFFILFLLPRRSVDNLFVLYGKLQPYYLVLMLVAWVFVNINPIEIYFPGAPIPLLYLKSGDVGVHLAGAAAFMLLRLDLRSSRWSSAKLWFLWTLWIANWVAWGATNRAGLLTALVGIGVVLLWRPTIKWYRPLVLAALMLGLVFVVNFEVSLDFTEREVSAQQLVSNAQSIFEDEGPSNLEGTEEWRTSWWRKIAGYTFNGEYFWTGKGYGVDLAYEDGFKPHIDAEVRNPHNASMAILARSGVPGLILWLLFLASFGWLLVRKAMSRATNTDFWSSRYALWLLAYWLAFLFNSSFDVFLEGPMGGVWFWSLIGMSMVYFGGSTGYSKTSSNDNRQSLM